MEREVAVYRSPEEAAEADRRYYRQLTPEQRIQILLKLIQQHREATGATSERLERVYRIVELPRR
jgi:hypothetical protein